jgi:hypothetical protein
MVDIGGKDGWCQDPESWQREALGRKAVAALKANMFDAVYFPDREEAVRYIMGYCQPGKTVAHGGSMTLMRDMGLPEKIKASGATYIENAYGAPEEMAEARRKQLLSDVFLCSVNALTMDGWLVSVDGAGNRTGAMTFGPKKVIVVAGTNKLVPDLDAAWQRLERVATPLNMKRLSLPNPCTQTGYCMDCRSEARGCRIYTVVKRKPMLTDMTVVVVGEELGY